MVESFSTVLVDFSSLYLYFLHCAMEKVMRMKLCTKITKEACMVCTVN